MAYQLTRQEADRLVRLPKRIDEPIRWTRPAGRAERHSFRVIVTCSEPDEPMVLHGFVGQTNWSFVLVAGSRTPIRKLTVHDSGHTNPDGSDAGTHHKHVWDEVHMDRETYYPIDIDFSDVNRALLGFLTECNVAVSHPPELLTIQRRLR